MVKKVYITTFIKGLQYLAQLAIKMQIACSFNGGSTLCIEVSDTIPESMLKAMKKIQKDAIAAKMVYEEMQLIEKNYGTATNKIHRF